MDYFKTLLSKRSSQQPHIQQTEQDPLVKTTETGDDFTSFGKKSIGFFGGLSLNLNNMTGPGMVSIPIIYQQAGWFTATVGLVAIMFLSTLSASFLCEAIALVPQRSKPANGRVELTTLAHLYFNRFGYILTHILLFGTLTAQNIASIVISAQTMDSALLAAFKWTAALEIAPKPGFPVLHTDSEGGDSPFGGSFVISIGFLIILLITIPLGYFNLDDNIHVQKVAVMFLFLILIEWFVSFGMAGFHSDYLPTFGSNQTQLLGTIIFNYAYVVSIPSWVNEKKSGVSINKTIWTSSISSTVLFIMIGILGSLAYRFEDGDDLLTIINSRSTGSLEIVSKVLVYVFPMVVLLTSIPVFSIIVRYNLVESNICGKFWANFWGVLFPWGLALLFYPKDYVQHMINWTSLIINGFINFIIPVLLFLLAKKSSLEMRPTSEVPSNAINSEREDPLEPEVPAVDGEEYQAVPSSWGLNSTYVAYAVVSILFILIMVAIISDIVLFAMGKDVFN